MQKITVLIIGVHYPEPKSTGAGVRMLQLLKLLKANGFDLHFATASQKTEFSLDIKALGIKEHHIELNSSRLDLLLKTLDPKVVVFDRFITEEQFGWKVDEVSPKALKILDTEDLHFLREERELKLKGKLEPDNFLSDKAIRELSAMYRCDLNLIISKFEFELLKGKYAFPEVNMHYLPFLVERDPTHTIKRFSERQHFVSIGNYRHKPNLDMVVYTSKNIWPFIKDKLPNAEWHIYGAYMPSSIQQLNSPKKGILVKGRTKEAVPTLGRYKLMLAYLRFGAGLKQKCIDAMAAGTPICTTAIGAEGLTIDHEFAGSIEDSIDGFIDKVTWLHTDEAAWEEKQANGFSILDSTFSPNLHSKKAVERINDYVSRLDKLRSENLFGQLLKHNLFKSTKYMSLWIQEKNKNRLD